MERDKFEAVFRDSQVIDVDLSMWDERVRLIVIAREETASPTERLPVYQVDFVQTTEINCRFRHWGYSIPQGHFQWNIDDASISEYADSLMVELKGSSHLPVLEIRCKDVVFSLFSNDILDALTPGWNRPGQPLARLGIAELVQRTS